MEPAQRSTSPTLGIVGLALQVGLAIVVTISLVNPSLLSGDNPVESTVIVLLIPTAIAGFVLSALAIGLRAGTGRALGIAGIALGALVFIGFVATVVVATSSVMYAPG